MYIGIRTQIDKQKWAVRNDYTVKYKCHEWKSIQLNRDVFWREEKPWLTLESDYFENCHNTTVSLWVRLHVKVHSVRFVRNCEITGPVQSGIIQSSHFYLHDKFTSCNIHCNSEMGEFSLFGTQHTYETIDYIHSDFFRFAAIQNDIPLGFKSVF